MGFSAFESGVKREKARVSHRMKEAKIGKNEV